MTPNFVKNFILLIFSTILSIFIIEFFYNLYQISNLKVKNWNHGGNKFDQYIKLRKTEKNLVVTTPPVFLLNKKKINSNIFPLSGISNLLTIDCNENGYFSKYLSDRYGFNNKNELWDKKIDLLLIGDSAVLGSCVNYSDTLAGNLNLKYNTISLGYGGNGPLIELGTIKEYIHLVKPKKVLWVYSEVNDLSDMLNELKNPILKKYLSDENFSQNLYKKQKIINEIQNKYFLEELKKFKNKKEKLLNFDEFSFSDVIVLKNLRHLIFGSILGIYSKKYDKNIDSTISKFNEIIKKANNIVKSHNAELIFILNPDRRVNRSNKSLINNEKIINIIKKQKIKFISLDELMFVESGDAKKYYSGRFEGSHFNENGYKTASEIILRNIFK
tara:strand:- start:786 stop:1943 length:1158 start_codon:yes stop_codon:yes gene_type:complete